MIQNIHRLLHSCCVKWQVYIFQNVLLVLCLLFLGKLLIKERFNYGEKVPIPLSKTVQPVQPVMLLCWLCNQTQFFWSSPEANSLGVSSTCQKKTTKKKLFIVSIIWIKFKISIRSSSAEIRGWKIHENTMSCLQIHI